MINLDPRINTSESYIKWLRDCADSLSVNNDVRTLADIVLMDANFVTWTGGLEGRHLHGTGLLLKHTYEVVYLCMQQGVTFTAWGRDDINLRVLFLAALYHDYGKIWDYGRSPFDNSLLRRGEPYWYSSLHHRLIHHINRSVIEFSLVVDRTQQCADIQDAVIHAILSHHGSPNLGSPVTPRTREAWILHLCDSMSAWMDGADIMEAKK